MAATASYLPARPKPRPHRNNTLDRPLPEGSVVGWQLSETWEVWRLAGRCSSRRQPLVEGTADELARWLLESHARHLRRRLGPWRLVPGAWCRVPGAGETSWNRIEANEVNHGVLSW